MKYLYGLFVIFNMFLILPHDADGQGRSRSVGIPSRKMEFYVSDQHKNQWCWAASIQMILNYYEVHITQEQIVERTYGCDPYGRLPNWGGSYQNITDNLNNWSVDNSGKAYNVSARLGRGAPTPAILVEELTNGRPVLAAYSSGPSSGHAVVITGVDYTNGPNGPIIQKIIVRDPYPTQENIRNRGRVEYTAIDLAAKMQHFWYIRVNGGRTGSRITQGPSKQPQPCRMCSGRGFLICRNCGGQGAISCSNCRGNGGEFCSVCSGNGQLTCAGCGGYGCWNCRGSGRFTCANCRGQGSLSCNQCLGSGGFSCRSCRGNGKGACHNCGGTGLY